MDVIDLAVALVFLGLTLFVMIRTKEWWLAAFAVVTGLLFARTKAGGWGIDNLHNFGHWIVSLFQ